MTETENKLSAISAVLRLGHEAFHKKGLYGIGLHIVNNSRLISDYERCCIVDMRHGKPQILSVMGQSEVNSNSEYCVEIKRLTRPFLTITKPVALTEEVLKTHKADNSALEAFHYFQKMPTYGQIFLLPMRSPGTESAEHGLFLWVLEFSNERFSEGEKNLLALLSQHYSEALWYNIRPTGISLKNIFAEKRILSQKVLAYLVIIFLLSLFLIRPRQSAIADFELIPAERSIHYAPFSGVLKLAKFDKGEKVAKNDVVIEYDVDELNFELAQTQKSYEKISTELDLVRQSSFFNPEELGNVKLLELKKSIDKVNIDKLEWYLSKSKIRAAQTGLLIIDDRENLRRKAVCAGDKLFEVISDDNLNAKVMLHETNASVLQGMTGITLYLHSRPEMSFTGKVVSVSPKPILTEERQFCYIIELKLSEKNPAFVCGMRGIGRVKGKRVSLAYYLFRNLILWWRRV